MELSGAMEWSGFLECFFLSQNVCHLGSDEYLCLTPILKEITRSTGF